ncbi:MAG: PIN domain-containing protein [Candidatus Omnitrophica bacterium]|nr:PIN domain-containing protein [Candidatus Omnitrophota bacterium]
MSGDFKNFQSSKLPEVIYCDTNIFVNALIINNRYHTPCVQFIQRLASEQVLLVFSTLLIAELRCAILSQYVRDKYGKDARIMSVLKKHPQIIKAAAPSIRKAEKDFEGILQRFTHWSYIPVDEQVVSHSKELMFKYQLASYDAIHIATMEIMDIKDIVVIDGGVEDIYFYKNDCSVWTVDGWERYVKRHPHNASKKNKIKAKKK